MSMITAILKDVCYNSKLISQNQKRTLFSIVELIRMRHWGLKDDY